MSEHCIIKADFSKALQVPGRKCLQLIFEVPIEAGDDALMKLGGFPHPGKSQPCAIALLNKDAIPVAQLAEAQVQHVAPDSVGSSPAGVTTTSSAEGAAHKKHWNELKRSQQAYLLCQDQDFWRYLGCAQTEGGCKAAIKNHFRIQSRNEFDLEHNHARWDEFVALYHLHRERHK